VERGTGGDLRCVDYEGRTRSSDINSLSDRELEIFAFIGRGFSVSELASELHVSVKTIETHQMRMKEKLALHGAAELRQKARALSCSHRLCAASAAYASAGFDCAAQVRGAALV
jgi:DNA-binding CsgD family transcriptional regulator